MNGINDLPTVSPLREAPATIKKKNRSNIFAL